MDNLLKINEAAAEMRVTTRTIRNWIRDGKLKAIQTCTGHWRINRIDLDRCKSKAVTSAN